MQKIKDCSSKENIDSEFLLFWSINEKFDLDEIERQIEWMHKNGVTGFFIHSRAGREIDYLSEQWEQLCATAIKSAEKFGMKAWLYDEDGWPSGFAGGLVPNYCKDYAMKSLGYGRIIPENADILAAYSICEDNKRVCCDPKDADEFLYITYDSFYADLLNGEAVRYFINTTHEWYKERFSKYFGNVIPGIFTDEPQFNRTGYCWSDSIIEEYFRRYKVSVFEDIWKIFVPELDFENEIRYRYFRLVSYLFSQSFTKQIGEWCEKNNLMLTGHFPNEDGLVMQVDSCGDVCANYEYMQLPGIDHLGNRITSPVLLKQISSISGQLGKEKLLSETFGCSGWDVKFKELAWIWGYQAAQGITVPCLHLSAYSIKGIRKRDYPPFFSYQNNWADEIGVLTDIIKKISTFIPRKAVKNGVLVISPIASVMRQANGSAIEVSSGFRTALENLLNNQIAYDIGDPEFMRKYAEVCGDELKVGKNFYKTLVVTPFSELDEDIKKLLGEFSANGGRFVFLGDTAYRNMSGYLAEGSKSYTVSNNLGAINKFFCSQGYSREFAVYDSNGGIAKDVVVTYTTPFDRAMVCNNSSSAQEVSIVIEGEHGLRRYDFNVKEFKDMEHARAVKGKTYFKTVLPARSCCLFELCESPSNGDKKISIFNRLNFADVRLTKNNTLTIDKCRYRIDSGELSGEKYVLHTHDDIYNYSRKMSKACDVQYFFSFNADQAVVGNKLSLCVEDEAIDRIYINGNPLDKRIGWYIDRAIGEYDITDLTVGGKNEITLCYTISEGSEFENGDEVFETERNRFFYQKEPESVYICGDFDVAANGAVDAWNNCYKVEDSDFKIMPAGLKSADCDLTKQGLWFYCGNARYLSEYDYNGGTAIIRFENLEATLAHVYVNGEHAADIVTEPLCADITRFLKNGKNTVEIEIVGNNRNLLGPHHHCKGRLKFVGVDSFKGQYSWTDFVNPELNNTDEIYTEDYSFISFSAGDVYIDIYE